MQTSGRIGQIIGQRYKLVAELGSGGQGFVFRGLDLKEGDEVAVKVLEPSPLDVHLHERNLREAHALTVLTGTAAVRILHQAWTDDGAFCIVMELLRGSDLEKHLRAREARRKLVTLRELAPILVPIVDTLEIAHQAGILHRDIKPGNIFILDAGGVRLLDFGFAKFTRMRPVTQAGWVAGSPSYIAPEIWEGATELDQRIDVYSLGAVIFRALAGTPPFMSENVSEVLVLATTAPRPSLKCIRADLPAKIDDWVEHALAISPKDRFSSARALLNAFDTLV
jgi:eukaryotic-like serine/threonine-protein kinase